MPIEPIIEKQVPINFDWSNISLQVYDGILRYITDIEPSLEWKARGRSGHSPDEDAAAKLKRSHDDIPSRLKQPEYQQKFQAFIKEALDIFSDLVGPTPPKSIRQIFGDKPFLFIIGYMRTGGTYFWTEMQSLHGFDYTDYPMSLTGDAIPNSGYIHGSRAVPMNLMTMTFQIAQYLTWAKHEQINLPAVIKKKIDFHAILRRLQFWFGDQAQYFFTVRHPLTATQSFATFENCDVTSTAAVTPPGWRAICVRNGQCTEKEWDGFPYWKRGLLWWESMYRQIAIDYPTKGKADTVIFGPEYLTYLSDYAKSIGREYEPTKLNFKEKDPISAEAVKEADKVIKNMSKFWSLYGLKFPNKLDHI